MPIPAKKKLIETDDSKGRWKCPSCGAIHHFDSKVGCCNRAHCKYKGKLKRYR